MRNLNLLLYLLLGHLIVDHLEPMVLLRWRKANSLGMLVHGGIHALACLLPLLLFTTVIWAFFWSIFIGLTHFLVDLAKVWLVPRLKGFNLPIYLTDQAIHVGLIIVVSSSLTVPAMPLNIQYAELVVGIVAVSAAGSVLIFETYNSLNRVIPNMFPMHEQRFLSMGQRAEGWVERSAAFVLFLQGYPELAAACFLPRLIYFFIKHKNHLSANKWIELPVGLATAWLNALIIPMLLNLYS